MSKEEDESNSNIINDPIIHILVIGFHHKKGSIIEYCYPELPINETDGNYILPNNWKHLPSLALPDGAHNYEHDSVYFHLLDDSCSNNNATNTTSSHKLTTIFGISCYRQINANELHNRDADVTRTTVQKSVCLLTRLPLYGFLKQKLNLITYSYFQQKNFQNTLILKESYNTLNNQLKLQIQLKSLNQQQFNIGLNLTELVLKYEHKILILFKLMLLERKVLFYVQPVNKLSNCLISLVSLLPAQFDLNNYFNNFGLYKSSNNLNLNYFNDVVHVDVQDEVIESGVAVSGVNVNAKNKTTSDDFDLAKLINDDDEHNNKYFNQSKLYIKETLMNTSSDSNNNEKLIKNETESTVLTDVSQSSAPALTTNHTSQSNTTNELKAKVSNVFKFDWLSNTPFKSNKQENNIETTTTIATTSSDLNNPATPTNKNSQLKQSTIDLLALDFGMPFDLYTNGNILHPYLSLHYLEYLKSNSSSNRLNSSIHNYNLKAYTIGATNFLFKQRLTSEIDVIIDEQQIEIKNEQLKKDLQLTTADLRFADYIVKHVLIYQQNKQQTNNQSNNNINAIEEDFNISITNDDNNSDANSTQNLSSNWEGSDEWVRLNFKLYLYSLLATIIKSKLSINNFNKYIIKKKSSTQSISSFVSVNSMNNLATAAANNSINNRTHSTNSSNSNANTTLNSSNSKKVNNSTGYDDEFTHSAGDDEVYGDVYGDEDDIYDDFDDELEAKLELLDDYNLSYVNSFMNTSCYKQWSQKNIQRLEKEFEINSNNNNVMKISHPFNGQLNINDLKLRLMHTFSSTESGRKLNKAIIEGSKLVSNTGKAVVGSITQARSSLSSFLNNISSKSSILNLK